LLLEGSHAVARGPVPETEESDLAPDIGNASATVSAGDFVGVLPATFNRSTCVSQFADVSPPGVSCSAAIASSLKRIGFQPFVVLTCEAKCPTNAGISSRRSAQRRQSQREDEHTMKEVLPEFSIADKLFEIMVSSHDDAARPR